MAADSEKRPELQDLLAALRGGRPGAPVLAELLAHVHAADLAEWLEELDEPEESRVLAALEVPARAELLRFSDEDQRRELVERLDDPALVAALEHLPADDAVDLLALVEPERSERVLGRVDLERATRLRRLASYPPDSAGGLMTTEYVVVSDDAHVGDAIKEVKAEEAPAREEESGVFVVDGTGKLAGFVSDRELLTTGIHTPIADVMDTDVITISPEADEEEVARVFRKYAVEALPVVDGRGRLLGVISAEDASAAGEEAAEEDMLLLGGTSPEEQRDLPILVRVRNRLPLQVLTVLGGLATAAILQRAMPHDGAAGTTTDILRYLPIIIGLAGNVGIQSSTLFVRAYATGELSRGREPMALRTEVLVGLLLGLICGAGTLGAAALLEGDPFDLRFGSAIGGAVSVAVTWAALLGCLVPISCQRLGIDPAVVAGPFLITLSDVSGSAIFVVVAKLTLVGA